ncbi:MAG: hypothetical protein IJJ33_16585, partial [Victivallales bacterium]|nr:hypothetical protein [Victivallales bacterium]
NELFPDASITLRNGRCNTVLFYKNDRQGQEIINNSLSLLDGVKIPRREVEKLQGTIERLHQLSLDPNCAPSTAEFLRYFRLPNPDALPEAWRITERGRRLLVLWGYWRGSQDSLLLPKSAVADSQDWKNNDKRCDLVNKLKPYTTPLAPLPVKIIIAVLLVLLLLWGCPKCCSGKHKENPQPPQATTENGMTKEAQGSAAANLDTPQFKQQRDDAMLPQCTPEQRAQALQSLEELQKNGRTLSEPQRNAYQKLLLKNIQDDMEKLRRQIQEVANDQRVPAAIRQSIVHEDQRDNAVRQIRQRVARNQATPGEQRLCQTLENRQKTSDKNAEESRLRSEDIANTISDLNKWREKANQGKAQTGESCPECHFTAAAFTPRVLGYSLTPDLFCEVKLQFIPTCDQVRDFRIDYLKIGYLAFQRKFNWDASRRIMSFRLKQSEIKDGKLRMLATASYTHAGQTLPAEFALTVAVSSTKKTTITVDDVNVFAR